MLIPHDCKIGISSDKLVATTTAGVRGARIAAGFAATCTTRFARYADELNTADALGYWNAFHSGAATFVDDANAFAAGDFFLHTCQLQTGRLAAAATIVGVFAAGVAWSTATTISKARGRGTEKGSGKYDTQGKLRHQFVSKTR
jgi:hypothetical protein